MYDYDPYEDIRVERPASPRCSCSALAVTFWEGLPKCGPCVLVLSGKAR